MLSFLRRQFATGAGGRRLEHEIREEMLAHIALCADDNVAAGMDPASARRDAERRFGNLDHMVLEGGHAKRDRRDPLGQFPNRTDRSPGASLMTDLLADIRFGLRMLVKSPMFSTVAIVSLAVGIGFNTTMFTLVDALLFTPLPAADPDSVVRLGRDGTEFGDMFMSYPDFLDVRENAGSFTGLAAVRTEIATYNADGEVDFVFGESVSANYFGVLGIPPLVGRTFAPQEDVAGNHNVAMVSEKFWRDRLGGTEAALGSELRFGGSPHTLIGVVDDRYTGLVPPLEVSFWLPTFAGEALRPVTGATSGLERRGSHSFHVIGRLGAGTTIEQATADVVSIGVQLGQDFPDTNGEMGFTLFQASDLRIEPGIDKAMLPAAGVLMGLVGLVLLLACANVANMMLARGSVRRQEIAIRLALGAGRGRLVRQLLTESMMLSLIGGLLAVVIAKSALQLLLAIQPPIMVPISLAVDVSGRVWLFTAVVAMLTGLAFGLVPALRSTRADLSQSLRGDEAGDSGRLRGSRLRSSLVVAQVTLSLVLLVAAALMVRSLQNAQSIDPGIATESVVNMGAALAFQGYSPDEAQDFYLRAMDRIAALPGVTQVAFAERLPLESTMVTSRDVYLEGQQLAPGEDPPSVMTTSVDPNYFDVMGIGIDQGRRFTAADVKEAPPVVIINEVLAADLWPGQAPIGKRLSVSGADGPFAEVVGIHSEHKVSTLGEGPTRNIYVPYAQDNASGFGSLLARTQGDQAAVLTAMRQILREMDPGLAVMEVETISEHLALSLFPVRLAAAALGLLGVIGALLASVGVYGVIAFAVSQRTREIGIRMAIGADRRSVVRMVLGQGMRLILIGAGIGIVLSLASTRMLGALLYGVSSVDVLAYVAAAAALCMVGVIANLVPALRASHVEPSSALRTR